MTEIKDRRAQVWTDEKAAFESLVALDENSIFIASPDTAKIAAIAEQIRSGTPPMAALQGSKAKQIPLDALKYIKSNRHAPIVYYKVSGADGRDKQDNFTIKQEQRDDLFTKLDLLRSRGFEYTETQFNHWRAAFAPLLTIGIVALLTFLSHQAAIQMAEEGAPRMRGRHALLQRLFVWALDILGPTGVIIAGGMIGVLCLVWMARRVATPPLMLEYKRAK